jgi:CMP-N,N'-diacetyllegionaminic acid synthase
MDMMTKILGIIPARGGSKGIHRKNIVDFVGKPLMAWTILASLASKSVSRTIVTSDDDEILFIAKKLGAFVLRRPDSLSDDFSTSESLVLHALEYEKEHGRCYDAIALLQPTSPLRSSSDIDGAFKEFYGSNANSLVSICEIDNKFLKSFFRDEQGRITSIYDGKLSSSPRQFLPKTFAPNGAIYIVKAQIFSQFKSFYPDACIGYEMPQEKSIDIDTPEDLVMAAEFARVYGTESNLSH